ncbi:hypothetical protein M3201_05235 [Paenibacillus motobuensis]|uniref:prenyltransferase/squalene oxidase repeat-containing protein n=1 Tax=Paenibacillus TaxID=44249 RepID=UPI00203A4A49|nr:MULTISPECIES: hypothetical protein [Paenibacillus]MCM3039099.1 hypothetical protein [Paenibacillus lutimineralis]MCM3646203.1 hypothetical protein [Paenibacillus motobuensis]
MRKLHLIIIVILLSIVFLVLNPFLINDNRNKFTIDLDNNISQISFSVDREQLNKRVDLLEEPDGGFGYLSEEAHNLADLYSTYYARKALHIIGSEPLPLPGQYSFGKDLSKVSLPDLYYFYSIYKTNVDISTKKKTNILLDSLKKNNGTFYLSLDDKEKAIDDGLDYLSTYMALSISSVTGKDINTINSQWLSNVYVELLNSDQKSSEKISVIKNLISIDKLIKSNVSYQYKRQIEKVMLDFCNSLNYENQNSYSLLDINNLLFIDDILGTRLPIPSDFIADLIDIYENDDNGYSLFLGDKSNALPTFLAIDNLNKLNILSDLQKEKVEKFLKRYELHDGLYAPIDSIEADIVSTYYVFLISKETGQNFNYNINMFLEKNPNLKNHPYYWRLMLEVNPGGISENNKLEINQIFADSVEKYIESNNLENTIIVYRFLETMNDLGISISNDTRISLIEASSKELKRYLKKDPKTTIQNFSYNLRILHQLGIDSNKLINNAIQMIAREIEKDLPNDKVDYLYHALIGIKEIQPIQFTELFNKSALRNQVMQAIRECYVGKGLFSYGDDKENIDLKSTYYGLWVYESISQ